MLVSVFTVALIVLSVIAHELAHGYMALHEGDDTAFCAGRLSWNPLKHVDPVLTVLLPLITWIASHGTLLFGGAKPVPVNPRRYWNGERSDLLVSLAGVAANAVIAVVCFALSFVVPLFERVALLNVALVVFNLLPIRPLDGWRVWRIVRDRSRKRRTLSA